MDQRHQATALRLTGVDTEHHTQRLNMSGELQAQVDRLAGEVNNSHAEVQTVKATLKELGSQRIEFEVPLDLEELRRGLHEQAASSRLQSEKLAEMERTMIQERSARKKLEAAAGAGFGLGMAFPDSRPIGRLQGGRGLVAPGSPGSPGSPPGGRAARCSERLPGAPAADTTTAPLGMGATTTAGAHATSHTTAAEPSVSDDVQTRPPE